MKNPFNVKNILNNKHKIIIPIFNLGKLKVEYFSNHKDGENIWIGDFDIYDVVKATIAAPVIWNKIIPLGDQMYCDAGMAEHFIIPKNNFKSIFVIQNQTFFRSKLIAFFFLLRGIFKRDKALFKFAAGMNRWARMHKSILKLQKNKKALNINGIKKLSFGFNYNLTESDLRHNFNVGTATYDFNKNKIEDFLN